MTDKTVLRSTHQDLVAKFSIFRHLIQGMNLETITDLDREGIDLLMLEFQKDLAALEVGFR